MVEYGKYTDGWWLGAADAVPVEYLHLRSYAACTVPAASWLSHEYIEFNMIPVIWQDWVLYT